MPTRKPMTLWQTLQRTPPFACLAMAVRRDRKRVTHKSIAELAKRSGIKRRTLQAWAYRREWPLTLKLASDFADACGVNLLARDPRAHYRRMTNGMSVKQLLRPEQLKGMIRAAKAAKDKPIPETK